MVNMISETERYLNSKWKKEIEKDIWENRNHSWYDDLFIRNKGNLQDIALFYRGNEITYGQFFDMVNNYAKSLKQYGIKKGDSFVACLKQTPDYPVLVAAASLICATIKLIAADFNKDYIAEIVNASESKIVFINDWDFSKMVPAIEKFENKSIVVLPVSKWEKDGNPYKEITDRFFVFDRDEYQNAISKFKNIISIDTFLDYGKKYTGEVNEHGKLNDDLVVTYTSGSTKKGYHKGVVQKNKSYIIMGRYHDPEVAGIPAMKNTITLTPIGVQADTTLMTGVSDTLMQGGILALDPITDVKYFLYSMKINNGGLVIATRTYWLEAMKETYSNPEFRDFKLPGLYVPSEGGEPLTAGEEKALNKWLKNIKAGTRITHTPFSVVKMTVGGGDTEQGSIFLTLYRGYYNILQKLRGIGEPIGMGYYDFAEVEVLGKDGKYCKPMEMGRLVANSATGMDRYDNNEEDTKNYYITDYYGKRWGNLNVYGYKDKWRKVYVKGRIGENDPEIKTFEISKEIEKDKNNIMSCEVVGVKDADGNLKYIAHIEFQFDKKVNKKRTLLAAEKRVYKKFGNIVTQNLFFRVRTFEEGYPILFTTKRNILALKEEGISDKCIIPHLFYLKGKK